MSAAQVQKETEPLVDPLIGSRVGLYLLDHRIGQGGMGIVYLARHERIGQLAAVKVLLRDLAQDGKVLQRFLDEARAMTLVQHPSIVKVFDYGQLADGTPYIMMELLEGESLQGRINAAVEQGSGLPLPMALAVARQIASALAIIHQKHIIHRDLKPENIYVVPDPLVPSGERVKLLDFGLAKILDEQVRRTTEGMVLGTPLYMAPEQCDGSQDIDDRADVYALGALLFEMLVGRPPFLATSASALMYQHVHKPAPPLTELAQDVPPDLVELLLAMLAKVPAERPGMDEIAPFLEILEQETRGRGPLLLHGQTPLVIGGAGAADGLNATVGPEPDVCPLSPTMPAVAPIDPNALLDDDSELIVVETEPAGGTEAAFRSDSLPRRRSLDRIGVIPPPGSTDAPPRRRSLDRIGVIPPPGSADAPPRRRSLDRIGVIPPPGSTDAPPRRLSLDRIGVIPPPGSADAPRRASLDRIAVVTAPDPEEDPAPTPDTAAAGLTSASASASAPAPAPVAPHPMRAARWLFVAAGVVLIMVLGILLRDSLTRRSGSAQSPPSGAGPQADRAAQKPGPGPAVARPDSTQPAVGASSTAPADPSAANGADKADPDQGPGGKRKRKRAKLKKEEGDPMAVFREQ